MEQTYDGNVPAASSTDTLRDLTATLAAMPADVRRTTIARLVASLVGVWDDEHPASDAHARIAHAARSSMENLTRKYVRR